MGTTRGKQRREAARDPSVKLSQDHHAAVVNLYRQQHLSTKSIGRRFGVSETTITAVLQKAQITVVKAKAEKAKTPLHDDLPPEQYPEVYRLYHQENYYMSDIAKDMGVRCAVISRILRSIPKGEARRYVRLKVVQLNIEGMDKMAIAQECGLKPVEVDQYLREHQAEQILEELAREQAKAQPVVKPKQVKTTKKGRGKAKGVPAKPLLPAGKKPIEIVRILPKRG